LTTAGEIGSACLLMTQQSSWNVRGGGEVPFPYVVESAIFLFMAVISAAILVRMVEIRGNSKSGELI